MKYLDVHDKLGDESRVRQNYREHSLLVCSGWVVDFSVHHSSCISITYCCSHVVSQHLQGQRFLEKLIEMQCSPLENLKYFCFIYSTLNFLLPFLDYLLYTFLLTFKPTGMRPLGRPRRRSEDNIRMDLEEIGINAASFTGTVKHCK